MHITESPACRLRDAQNAPITRKKTAFLFDLDVPKKELTVADGLRKNECTVDHERHDRDEHELARRIVRTGSGDGIVGKDERQDDNGPQGDQGRTDPVEAKVLSRCMAPPTSRQSPMIPFRMIITAANTGAAIVHSGSPRSEPAAEF